jgi:hypothetical protein
VVPQWRELFYRNIDKMMAVSISYNPKLVAGQPQMLFEKTFQRPGGFEEFFTPTNLRCERMCKR